MKATVRKEVSKYGSEETITTMEFSAIEMHLLTSALQHYSHNAYGITGNINHSEAVEKLYYATVDVYCAEVETGKQLSFEFEV